MRAKALVAMLRFSEAADSTLAPVKKEDWPNLCLLEVAGFVLLAAVCGVIVLVILIAFAKGFLDTLT